MSSPRDFFKSILDRGTELAEAAIQQLRLHLPDDPVPSHWADIVARNVPLARKLDGAQLDRLMHIVQLFLREIPFEGCLDTDVTEEMTITIAATASLLLLGLPYPRFTKVVRVLVYPGAFVPAEVSRFGTSIESDDEVVATGQAWIKGIVIIAWDQVLNDAADPERGHNVVMHEFAHMLDAEDGKLNGIPLLDDPARLPPWERTLKATFDRRDDADFPLSAYAGTNEAELFAVGTEAFFSMPAHLEPRLPVFYRQLARFYGRDPR